MGVVCLGCVMQSIECVAHTYLAHVLHACVVCVPLPAVLFLARVVCELRVSVVCRVGQRAVHMWL